MPDFFLQNSSGSTQMQFPRENNLPTEIAKNELMSKNCINKSFCVHLQAKEQYSHKIFF